MVRFLEAIAGIAEKHKLLQVSGETYEHIVDGKQHTRLGSIPAAQVRTISVFSMSKTYAMSGLRLGYLVLNSLRIQINSYFYFWKWDI